MTYDKFLAIAGATAVVGSGFALALAAPAVAQNGKPVIVRAQPLDADIPIRRVSYRDLNLASAEDQNRLNQRVRRAVTQVCLESTGRNAVLSVQLSCRSDSWDRAEPQIDLAVRRAMDIAANGYSSIAPVAIAIVAHQ